MALFDSLEVTSDVLIASLFVDSWVTVLWMVVSDLVLVPGVLGGLDNEINSELSVLEVELGEYQLISSLILHCLDKHLCLCFEILLVSPWVQKVLVLGDLISPALSVVDVVLVSVSWVVEISNVVLDISVPCFLSSWSNGMSALSVDFLWSADDVLVMNWSPGSWVAVLWIVVGDLVLVPGVLLGLLDELDSVFDIFDILKMKVFGDSTLLVSNVDLLQDFSLILEISQESPWSQEVFVLEDFSSP